MDTLQEAIAEFVGKAQVQAAASSLRYVAKSKHPRYRINSAITHLEVAAVAFEKTLNPESKLRDIRIYSVEEACHNAVCVQLIMAICYIAIDDACLATECTEKARQLRKAHTANALPNFSYFYVIYRWMF